MLKELKKKVYILKNQQAGSVQNAQVLKIEDTSDQDKYPATLFKFIQKGFGNINLQLDEPGDIFCGWSNDGTIRISEAAYIGGVLSDSNNFTPLVQTFLVEDSSGGSVGIKPAPTAPKG